MVWNVHSQIIELPICLTKLKTATRASQIGYPIKSRISKKNQKQTNIQTNKQTKKQIKKKQKTITVFQLKNSVF